MYRRHLQKLCDWKAKKKRKPLILMGARQVGKTYLLKRFAQLEFKNSVYLNFEDNTRLKKLFEGSLDPREIIRNIEITLDVSIDPSDSLIIFDEVQECPEALNSLKYFNEDAAEYHICSAGSLLGVKLMHTKGFPVGQVDFHHLYPLSFFEFLLAIGKNKLVEFLEDYTNAEPLPSIIHDQLIRLFRSYLFVGGMPEAIAEYVDTANFRKVGQIHQAILQAYSLDFAKHAPPEQVMKINQVWGVVPNQLAKENKKFIYSIIRKGARAKEFEEAVQWLKEAGLIYKTYNVSTPRLPLDAYANFEFFKLYLVDTGLLGAMSNLSPKMIIEGNSLFQEFKGALVENYVAQELARQGYGLYYWTSEGKAELDFLLQHEDAIYPIEVKSGNSGKKKSLRVYETQFRPEVLIRTSPRNLKRDGAVLNCPLYLIGRVGRFLDHRSTSI